MARGPGLILHTQITNCYSHEANSMTRILSALHENIQNQFNAAGVEIMSPAYHALRDGNTITLSNDELPQDYVAPGFRVNMQPAPPPRTENGNQPT